MKIDILENNTVEVQVTRTIRVGQILKINPSEAYLGIESGNITIIDIANHDELASSELRDMATDFINVETYTDVEDNVEFGRRHELEGNLWVAYKYHKDDEISVLPIDEFIEHTMNY